MLINSTNLDLVFRGFSARYRDAYTNAPVHGDRIAMTMPSEGREETYSWLGAFPTLREWIGARVVQNLSASQFTVVNKKFESTVEVARDHISDDRLGVFGPVFAEMGLMAAQHRDELIFGRFRYLDNFLMIVISKRQLQNILSYIVKMIE